MGFNSPLLWEPWKGGLVSTYVEEVSPTGQRRSFCYTALPCAPPQWESERRHCYLPFSWLVLEPVGIFFILPPSLFSFILRFRSISLWARNIISDLSRSFFSFTQRAEEEEQMYSRRRESCPFPSLPCLTDLVAI